MLSGKRIVPCSVTPSDCYTGTSAFKPYFDDSYSGAGLNGAGAWTKSIKVTVAGNVSSNLNMTVYLNSSNFNYGYYGGGSWNKTLSSTMSISISQGLGNRYGDGYYSRTNAYYNRFDGNAACWFVSINETDPNGDPEWGPTTISSFNGIIPITVHRVVSEPNYNLELSPIQEQKVFFTSSYSFATIYVDNNYSQEDSPQYGYGTTFWYNMSEYTATKEYFDQGTIAGGKCVSVTTGQRNGYYYSPAINSLSDITDGQRSIKIEAMS